MRYPYVICNNCGFSTESNHQHHAGSHCPECSHGWLRRVDQWSSCNNCSHIEARDSSTAGTQCPICSEGTMLAIDPPERIIVDNGDELVATASSPASWLDLYQGVGRPEPY